MELKNNEKCEHCGRFANRGISIDAVIVDNKKILLIKRGSDPYKGFWALPGGYVEWNESTQDAVKREVKEELNLDVIACDLIGVYSNPERHPKQVIDIAYSVKTTGDPKSGDDATDFVWLPLTELPDELAFDHRIIISDFLNQKIS
jgi:8-oxo-dGTP diphosphatase